MVEVVVVRDVQVREAHRMVRPRPARIGRVGGDERVVQSVNVSDTKDRGVQDRRGGPDCDDEREQQPTLMRCESAMQWLLMRHEDLAFSSMHSRQMSPVRLP